MSKYLINHPQAGYRFLPGSDPYSSGVIAKSGHAIVSVQLHVQRPWLAGLHAARRWLEAQGLHHTALCGVRLRCPKPHSLDSFGSFNANYHSLLEEWQLLVDGQNPIARTNGVQIAKLLTTMKQSVSRKAINWLKKNAPEFLGQLLDVQPNGKKSWRFWQRGGGYDRNLPLTQAGG